MLKILRSKKTAKKIWIALAVVIIPAFCLWGFGSALRGRKQSIQMGKVFGKSITPQEYLRNYKAIRNQYLIQFGEEQLAKLEKYLNFEAQILDRIVLLAESKRKKIRVSNREVVNAIKQYRFFKKEGRFDPELYRERITYDFRTSPRAFEEEMRDNLTIAKLFEKVTRGITVKDEEVKDRYIKENEQISLDYISALAEDFLDEVSLEDNDLLVYYNQNSEQFKKPLSYNLEYIKTDLRDRETLNKITQLLSQGSNLPDITKEMELELEETGLFSSNEPIPQIGWSTEISRILQKLEPNGKAWPQPIKTDSDTAYLVRLKEKKEPYIPSFEDIKDGVNQKLRQQKASQIAKEKLGACRNEVETLGFAEAAKKFDLKTDKTELFKRSGYVKGLGDSNIFFEAVKNLKENEISQIISIPSGFCVVKLKERIKPEEKEFEEKKQEFTNKLLGEKKQAHFGQFLTELKNRPNTFLSLESLIK